MPCHATPRRAMPCHVTSSCLPLQPIDCWSTWPRRRHQVNVRTQLVRSTSLAYSLTISRTRHRRRRRSTGIYNLPHHPPRPTTVNRLSTPPANLSLAVMYYVLRPRSRSMYTGHPPYRDPHLPRSLPIMQVAQKLRLAPLAISRRRRKPSPRRRFRYHRHYHHHHRHHLHSPPTAPTSPTPPTPPTPPPSPPSARRRRCRYRSLSPSPPN